MKQTLNLQDQVLGTVHQIVVQPASNPRVGEKWHITLDGATLPLRTELNVRLHLLFLAWEDEFEGLENKGDAL